MRISCREETVKKRIRILALAMALAIGLVFSTGLPASAHEYDALHVLQEHSTAGPDLAVHEVGSNSYLVIAWVDPDGHVRLDWTPESVLYSFKSGGAGNVKLDFAKTTRPPAIAQYKTYLYVAWTDADTDYVKIVRGSDFNFSNAVVTTFTFKSYAGPDLAVYKNSLYIAYAGLDGAIRLRNSSGGMQGFSFSPVLAQLGNTQFSPAIAAGPINHLHVAWAQDGKLYHMAGDGISFSSVASGSGSDGLVSTEAPSIPSIDIDAGPTLVNLSYTAVAAVWMNDNWILTAILSRTGGGGFLPWQWRRSHWGRSGTEVGACYVSPYLHLAWTDSSLPPRWLLIGALPLPAIWGTP